MIRTAAWSSFVAGLLLSSCANPRVTLQFDEGERSWRSDEAASLFDALDPEAVRGTGDLVSYRIESNASGELRRWDLDLSTGPIEEAADSYWRCDPVCGYVRVRAKRVWLTYSHAPNKRLVEYRASESPLRVKLTRDDHETFETTVEGPGVLHAHSDHVDAIPDYGIRELVGVLLKIDHLHEELISVVQAPSVWSVVSRGMRVDLRLDFGDLASSPESSRPIETVDSPFGEVPAFWLPFQLLANDQPALECRALITWRRSPLLHSVGVLRLEAWHPSDESLRVQALLTGAKRGEGSLPDTDDLGMGLRRGMSRDEVERMSGRSVGDPIDVTGSSDRGGFVAELLGDANDLPVWLVFDDAGLQFVGARTVVDEFLQR